FGRGFFVFRPWPLSNGCAAAEQRLATCAAGGESLGAGSDRISVLPHRAAAEAQGACGGGNKGWCPCQGLLLLRSSTSNRGGFAAEKQTKTFHSAFPPTRYLAIATHCNNWLFSISAEYAIRPEFKPQPQDVVITKQRASVFFGTPLIAHLTQLGV